MCLSFGCERSEVMEEYSGVTECFLFSRKKKKKQINREKFNYRSLMMSGCVCDSSEVMMDDGFGD